MKITTWNARGLNAPSKKRLLKKNLKVFEFESILLQETKLNKEEETKLEKKIGSWNIKLHESRGASRGLGFIWNPSKVSLDILNSNKNWLSSRVKSIKTNLQFILVNIYGPTYNTDKKLLWDEITLFINNHNKDLILLGDFNTILNIDEKYGGIQKSSQASKDFKYWCDSNNLIDILLNNGNYTWNNRRKDFSYIAEKLDRFFLKGEISEINANIYSSILPVASSNHFLVRIEFSKPSKPVRNLFKCEKLWFLDPKFLECIKDWWNQGRFKGSKMYIFVSKMKMLKEHILKWNKDHFNNISKKNQRLRKN